MATTSDTAAAGGVAHDVPFREAFWTWARIACLSFGGPAGQIAVMHRILVDEKQWISEARFLHALNYCMLLPGPEAQQLCVYIGWLLHRTLGGLVAGILFVLPGVAAIMALSVVYAAYGNVGLVEALFFGLKAAVFAIVLQAVIRVGGRALKNGVLMGLAAAAFIGIFFFDIPFPLIVLGAGVLGYLGGRAGLQALRVSQGHGGGGNGAADQALDAGLADHVSPSLSRAVKVTAIGLAFWLTPLLLLFAVLGAEEVFTRIASFFSIMAVVTFGGAYAVLAYVAQEAVQSYGWLQPGEMLDGLGMAETTPGPLIMVVQFVGFMAAFRDPGLLEPMTAGVLGGLLATWVTFAPCFLWIFLGAPFVETLRGHRALSAALTAITAAVVGVILNLAVWFGLHVLFDEVRVFRGYGLTVDVPVLATVQWVPLALAAASFVAIFHFRLGMIPTLLGAAAIGVAVFALEGQL